MVVSQEMLTDASRQAVSLRGIEVRYGRNTVIRDLRLDVPSGETTVILGRSGSGKTTLLKTMIGLLAPTAGEVILEGQNLYRVSPKTRIELLKRIGCSFQSGALLSGLTVGENIALPLKEHTRLATSTIEIMVRLKLEQVGLAGFEHYLPAELSGGMIKRAAVARALAMDPRILFFDEPSAGLDPVTAAGIDNLIVKLKEVFKMTIVVVTHELTSAFAIADRMVLIDKGEVVAAGTKDEFRGSHDPHVRVFLDRVPEPESTGGVDYLARLTDDTDRPPRVGG